MPPPDDSVPAPDFRRTSGFLRAVALAENAILVVLLAALVVLAGGQIVLRQIDVALVWADPLTRLLILWIAVFGAVAASRDGQHITIDALSRFLPPGGRRVAAAVVALFAAAVCVVLAYEAARFVGVEYAMATTGLAAVPAWVLALVLPLGFALIAVRYAIVAFARLRGLGPARAGG
jgi:TRAP-type C4-dicarboxylate transport system permease small subunit